MPSSFCTASSCAAALIVLTPVASATFEDLFEIFPNYSGEIEQLVWTGQELSGGNPSRSFGRTLPANLSENSVDALAELDGELIFIESPGRFQSFLPTGLSIADFDVHEGQGPDGRDAVVFVDDAGAWIATYDVVRRSWNSTLLSGAWASARAVRSDGSTLVALSSDGTTLHWFDQEGEASRPLAESCKTLEILDHDGDGSMEVLLLHSSGVTIAEIQSPVDLFDWRDPDLDHTRDQILAIPAGDDPSGCDLALYLCEPLADGVQWACVAEDGLGFVDFVGLGTIDIVGMSAALVNSDGGYDLLFTARSEHGILTVFNQRSPSNPSAPRYDNEFAFMMAYVDGESGSAATNRVQPAAADWDSDGDLELLYLNAGEDRYVMFEDHASPSTDLRPLPMVEAAQWNEVSSTFDLTVDIDAYGPNATLHVDVYEAASATSSIHPVPASSSFAETGEGLVEVAASLPSVPGTNFTQIYYFVLQVETAGGVLGHEYFAIWAADDQVAGQLKGGSGPDLNVLWNNGNDDPTEGGAFVPGRRGGSST